MENKHVQDTLANDCVMSVFFIDFCDYSKLVEST